jgi:hypothetical protein
MTDSPIFAQIPFELACRFGELSKNEIRVFVYLLARRNANSEQCNPRPVLIASDLTMDKGNVSKAISGLEDKNWIIWQTNGQFLFPVLAEKLLNLQLSESEKVGSSTTQVGSSTTLEAEKLVVLQLSEDEKLLNLQPKVGSSTTQVGSSTTLEAEKLVVLQLSEDEKLLNLQPKVGSSTTQVVKSTTLLNKDLEQTNNRQIEQEGEVADTTGKNSLSPEKENSAFENCVAVRMFTKTFGNDFRQSFLNSICLTVKNTDIWEKLLVAKSHKTPKMIGGWILEDYSVELKVAETAKTLNQIYKPPQPIKAEEVEEFETEIYEKFIDKKADGYADWLKLIAEIKNALHEQTFASWFNHLSFYGVDREKQVFIVRGTEVNQDWIEMNYLELIEKTAKKIGLENWSFEWKKAAAR